MATNYTRDAAIAAIIALFEIEIRKIDYPGRREYLPEKNPHWGEETKGWMTSLIIPIIWDYFSLAEKSHIKNMVKKNLSRRRSDFEMDKTPWELYCAMWRPLLDLPI